MGLAKMNQKKRKRNIKNIWKNINFVNILNSTVSTTDDLPSRTGRLPFTKIICTPGKLSTGKMAQLIQKKKVKTTMKKKEMEKVKMLKKRKAVNNKKGSEKEVLNLSDWTTTFLSLGTS